MSRWPQKALLEIARLTRGTEPGSESYTDSSRGARFLRVGDITGKTNNPIYTDAAQTVLVSEADVLLALDGSPGYVSTGHSGAISSGIRKVEPREPNKVSLDWLRYSLMSPDVQHTISKYTTGVTIAHAAAAIEHVRIPIPPLAEQERLVQILKEAEQLRQLRFEAERRTGELIPALFYEMFPLSGTASQNFSDATIEQLVDQRDGSIRTGPFGSDLLHSEFTTHGVPVLGIDNVVANEFRWTQPRCIPEDKYHNFKRFQVFPGDVLVTIMGTVGRCAVAPDDLPVCISTKHLCVMSLDRTQLDPYYLWASILFDESVRHQTRIVGSGAIMEGWNSTIIRKLKIRIPPLKKQIVFSSQVADVRAMTEKQAVCRQSNVDLLEVLLHRAFQGEL